ncbi:MAG TPA: chromate efflux transporter [Acidimicrobiales bacterium]|nr:chromate efflux transporter [Acidimicrobiales bacterium]
MGQEGPGRVDLWAIAAAWTRIGCIGFGGPPAHISLLRQLCVTDRGWLSEVEFEDAIAATQLLPGPASTQLAIWCAWRLRGRLGAVVGGCCFIVPGLVVILCLAALFLTARAPDWVLGAAAGAGAAVPAVAVGAAIGLMPASHARAASGAGSAWRWGGYLAVGVLVGALAGAWVVVALVLCGLAEVAARGLLHPEHPLAVLPLRVASGPVLAATAAAGGLGAVAWVAFKVGALSYGGGFVIIPLMQHDAVSRYHWMTATQFLSAVALGQITPGPVVQTVAVVGYAAAGVAGGLLAAGVAFAPSFGFVLGGGRHFGRLRSNRVAQAFLSGAGPASIGAIAAASVPLAAPLQHLWQVGVLAVAGVWILGLRRGVPVALVLAAAAGAVAALAGAPIGR